MRMRVFPLLWLLPLAAALGAAAQTPATQQPVDPASLSANASTAQQQQLDRYRKLADDYGQLSRYAAADAALPAPTAKAKRVIFFGDSITDIWHLDQYFQGKHYVNRGISGQTTPQMLVRFRQDVIDLRPSVLVVLAGTNDLAGNTGPETLTQIEDDYATMAELSKLHGIALVFSSVTPVSNYIHPDMTKGRKPEDILALNTWMKQYCAANHLVYLDYFSAMVDPSGMLKRDLSNDGLHPNAAGFAIMAPFAQAAVDKALATQ